MQTVGTPGIAFSTQAGASPLRPGLKVGNGRFVLEKLIGQGGMGIVWLAFDENLREPVALKFLPPAVSADPVALDDMRRETARSHKLTHPNIVRIHDFYQGKGEEAFISMEYVDGPNLSALRIETPQKVLQWDFIKTILPPLVQALDYAHSEKVVHRDLKPANLMLDGKGRLKLADFGIAWTLSDSMTRITSRPPIGTGTLVYMSPQQMAGDRPQTTDDIYSLGATLYELLTGKPPFYTGDITYQVNHVVPQSIRDRQLELKVENPVPPQVDEVILACLSKDASRRPVHAMELLDRLGLTNVHFAPVAKSGPWYQSPRILIPTALAALALGVFFIPNPWNRSSSASKNQDLQSAPPLLSQAPGGAEPNSATPSGNSLSSPAAKSPASEPAQEASLAVGAPVPDASALKPESASPAPAASASEKPAVSAETVPAPAVEKPVAALRPELPAAEVAKPAPPPPPDPVASPVPAEPVEKPAAVPAEKPVAPELPPDPVAALAKVVGVEKEPAAPSEEIDFSKQTAFKLVHFGNKEVDPAFQNNLYEVRNDRDNPNSWSVIFFDSQAKVLETKEILFEGTKWYFADQGKLSKAFSRRVIKQLDMSKLKVDSDEAWRRAKSADGLESAVIRSYEMKLIPEKGAPVWEIQIWVPRPTGDRDDVSLGKIYISAETGEIFKDDLKRSLIRN